MASLMCMRTLILLLIFTNSAAVAPAAAAAAISISKTYPAIFVFGDSLSDPGNMAIASKSSTFRTIQLPYGETFPGWPFGRYSDGHTLVDFLAAYMDLPFVNAYLNSSADFSAGVNYAFGGATALDTSFLSSLGISTPTNFSLEVQVALHLAYKASLESSNGFVNSLEACCGAGDSYPYNYNPLQICNVDSISLCTNTNAYMSWDGIHFTNSLNFQIFNQTFIIGSYLENLDNLL